MLFWNEIRVLTESSILLGLHPIPSYRRGAIRLNHKMHYFILNRNSFDRSILLLAYHQHQGLVYTLHYSTLHCSGSKNQSDLLLVCFSHSKQRRWKAFLVDRVREVLRLQTHGRVHGVAYRRRGRCGGEAHEISRVELQPRLSGEEL